MYKSELAVGNYFDSQNCEVSLGLVPSAKVAVLLLRPRGSCLWASPLYYLLIYLQFQIIAKLVYRDNSRNTWQVPRYLSRSGERSPRNRRESRTCGPRWAWLGGCGREYVLVHLNWLLVSCPESYVGREERLVHVRPLPATLFPEVQTYSSLRAQSKAAASTNLHTPIL